MDEIKIFAGDDLEVAMINEALVMSHDWNKYEVEILILYNCMNKITNYQDSYSWF